MVLDTNPWYYVTFLGDPRVWFSIAVIFFVARIYSKHMKAPHFNWVGKFILFSGFGAGTAFGASELLKHIFQIPRTCTEATNVYCVGIGTLSFPSSHAAIAFAAFVGMLYLIKTSKKWSIFKTISYYGWIFIVPVFVGISRVMLGVHTLLDVVGGIVTGILISILFIEIIIRIDFFKKSWLKPSILNKNTRLKQLSKRK